MIVKDEEFERLQSGMMERTGPRRAGRKWKERNEKISGKSGEGIKEDEKKQCGAGEKRKGSSGINPDLTSIFGCLRNLCGERSWIWGGA